MRTNLPNTPAAPVFFRASIPNPDQRRDRPRTPATSPQTQTGARSPCKRGEGTLAAVGWDAWPVLLGPLVRWFVIPACAGMTEGGIGWRPLGDGWRLLLVGRSEWSNLHSGNVSIRGRKDLFEFPGAEVEDVPQLGHDGEMSDWSGERVERQ